MISYWVWKRNMNIFGDYCTVGFFTWRQEAAGERGCWSPQSKFFPENPDCAIHCCTENITCWTFASGSLESFLCSSSSAPVTSPAVQAAHTPEEHLGVLPFYQHCCNTLKAPAKSKNKMCKLCWMATVHCWQDLCETGHGADLLVEVDQGFQSFLST